MLSVTHIMPVLVLSVTHIMLVLLSVVGVEMPQCMIQNHIFNI